MIKTVLLCTIALLVSACLTPTEACGCSPAPPPPALFVEGVVQNAQGTPMSGLVVNAVAYAGVCTAADSVTRIAGGNNAATNAAGQFRMLLESGSESANACLRVRAFRVASDAIGVPATLLTQREIPNVRVRGYGSAAKLDSVSVALSLP